LHLELFALPSWQGDFQRTSKVVISGLKGKMTKKKIKLTSMVKAAG
jgi:hypothetical protein